MEFFYNGIYFLFTVLTGNPHSVDNSQQLRCFIDPLVRPSSVAWIYWSDYYNRSQINNMDSDTGISIITSTTIVYLSIHNLSAEREGIYECKVEYSSHSYFPHSSLYSIIIQGKNSVLILTRMVFFS